MAASESMSLPSRAIDASTAPAMDAESSPIVLNTAPAPSAGTASEARRRVRELEPLSADRFGVHFTADAELRELIERARALASHRLPNGELAGLMKLMAASFVRQEEKRRFGVGTRPRRIKSGTERQANTERQVLSASHDQGVHQRSTRELGVCDANRSSPFLRRGLGPHARDRWPSSPHLQTANGRPEQAPISPLALSLCVLATWRFKVLEPYREANVRPQGRPPAETSTNHAALTLRKRNGESENAG